LERFELFERLEPKDHRRIAFAPKGSSIVACR
jgi:hypothetical protein